MSLSPCSQRKEPLRGGRDQVDCQPVVEDVDAIAVTAQQDERKQVLHGRRAQGVEHLPQGKDSAHLRQGREPRPLPVRNGDKHRQHDITQYKQPRQPVSVHERRDLFLEQKRCAAEEEPAIPNSYVMQAHDLWQELTAQAQPESGDQYGHTVNRPSEAPQDIAHHEAPEQHGQEPEMPIPPRNRLIGWKLAVVAIITRPKTKYGTRMCSAFFRTMPTNEVTRPRKSW